MKLLKKTGALLLALLLLSASVWAEEVPAEAGEPAAEEGKKLIALTFDDGPDKLVTAPVLDMLEKHGVRATFFILGCKLDEESVPLVERAVSLGCEIGCHGWDHGNMTLVSLEMTQKQLRKYENALATNLQVPVSVKLVRPPGGHSNAKVKRAVGELGYGIALWDVDSLDWKVQQADNICETVLKKVQDGSIILMHDRHQPTADALDILIPLLLEQGYEFVTVSELLTRNGEEIEPGKEYMFMRSADAE